MKKRKVVSQLLINKCPECGSQNLVYDYDQGQTICGNCGLVVREKMMDKGPEWRAFTLKEKELRSRVGRPETCSVHDKGLSTDIHPWNVDSSGKKLPLDTKFQMQRLRKWQRHSRAHSSIERNLIQAMTELKRLSDKLNIPKPVEEQAAVIYRKAVGKDIIRGRAIMAVIAAALYVACRLARIQRTLREIAEVSLVNKKDVARAYRILLRELDLKMPVANSIIYVSKIAEDLGISGETQGLAIKILRQAKEKRINSGKDPMGLAASALYCACLQNGEKKVQSDIAKIAGVTEVTIRNRYQELERELDLELPENYQKLKNS